MPTPPPSLTARVESIPSHQFGAGGEIAPSFVLLHFHRTDESDKNNDDDDDDDNDDDENDLNRRLPFVVEKQMAQLLFRRGRNLPEVVFEVINEGIVDINRDYHHAIFQVTMYMEITMDLKSKTVKSWE